MPQLFKGVLVYHAARPRRIATYYERGLLLADRAATKALAREIFVSAEFPEITTEAIDIADGVVAEIDDNRAFVCLDARGFLDHAGHYLIYGSEHLCAIAAHLGGHDRADYRQVLKRYGTPTIFRLALPFEFIAAADASELAGAVRRELRWIRNGRRASTIEFTFRLRRPLPPECVLDHTHPTRIIDPLLRMTTYVFDGHGATSPRVDSDKRRWRRWRQ